MKRTTLDPRSPATTDTLGRRPARVGYVMVGCQRLRVAVWPGKEGSVPLLLFNGIGASLEMLTPLADELEGIETIAFDIPGVGQSDARMLPYRLWMIARMTSKLLDQLGYGRVDAMGVSWGGTLAQQFAFQNPKRCRRVVLAATAQGGLMIPARPSVLRHFFTPARHNDAELRARIGGLIYGGKARTDPQLLETLKLYVKPASRYAYFLQQMALMGWTSLPFLPLVRQPVLVMAGSDDPVVPLINAQLMTAFLPRGRLHVFDDGHLFILSQTQETARVLREFLAAAETPAKAQLRARKPAAA